ncbi:MAG: glycosyltransferase family 4 protein [Coriobacteriia bacterium]|nr:glycosyltransferase family 4 protein [Coriobacteriia bacterium]
MRSLRDATIVFVNNFPGPTYGGGEVRMLALVRACLEAGMHVHVICLPDSAVEREARELGATVNRYALHAPNFLRTRSRIRKYLKRYDAAIVQGTGYLTNILVRLAGAPVRALVLNTGSVEPDAPRRAGASALAQFARDAVERLTRGRLDVMVTVSEAVAEEWAARGMPREKLVTIPSAIDVAAVQAAARAEVGLPAPVSGAEGPLVGMVGRLQDVKGGEVFVRAAALIAAEEPASRLLVVGAGPERDRLERLAAELIPPGRLAFTGAVSPAAPYTARLDVLAVPSLSEGLGHSAMEGMALGVPVVASRVGGLPEVVEDGVTGLLVPPSDPNALAGAILTLLADPERARRMGEAGRVRAAERSSSARLVKAHLDLYRRLLDRR